MRYLIAILLPPLAILLCGKPFQAILALILQVTILGWIPAAVWAILVVNSHQADKRTNRLVKEMRRRLPH
jgi:uncharacterized membrane protein YqaE (UPF0057 family)